MRIAGPTVRGALPETVPDVAVMVAGPTRSPRATPAAEIEALAVLDDQVTDAVMSWVEASE
jgi:hypothetical protein